VRVLDEIAIYPWIDNPHGLNEHPIVEKILEFNSTMDYVRGMISTNPIED
jgi:hypothetical protein